MLLSFETAQAESMENSNRLDNSNGPDEHVQQLPTLWWLWLHRYRTRKQLHALLLDDAQHLHHDLGLTTEAALTEINKPFWRR